MAKTMKLRLEITGELEGIKKAVKEKGRKDKKKKKTRVSLPLQM